MHKIKVLLVYALVFVLSATACSGTENGAALDTSATAAVTDNATEQLTTENVDAEEISETTTVPNNGDASMTYMNIEIDSDFRNIDRFEEVFRIKDIYFRSAEKADQLSPDEIDFTNLKTSEFMKMESNSNSSVRGYIKNYIGDVETIDGVSLSDLMYDLIDDEDFSKNKGSKDFLNAICDIPLYDFVTMMENNIKSQTARGFVQSFTFNEKNKTLSIRDLKTNLQYELVIDTKERVYDNALIIYNEDSEYFREAYQFGQNYNFESLKLYDDDYFKRSSIGRTKDNELNFLKANVLAADYQYLDDFDYQSHDFLYIRLAGKDEDIYKKAYEINDEKRLVYEVSYTGDVYQEVYITGNYGRTRCLKNVLACKKFDEYIKNDGTTLDDRNYYTIGRNVDLDGNEAQYSLEGENGNKELTVIYVEYEKGGH